MRALPLLFLAAACGARPEPPGVPPEVRERLAETASGEAKALGETLVGELKAAIEARGPEGAVRVCGDVAARVVAEAAARGVRIRRTTLRLRNPANAPDAFERAALEGWERELPAVVPSARSEVLPGPDGPELRFVAPIFVQGLCTDCHGGPGAIREGVLAALRETYPDDRATGYSQGDLRGAVSVRVPVPR